MLVLIHRLIQPTFFKLLWRFSTGSLIIFSRFCCFMCEVSCPKSVQFRRIQLVKTLRNQKTYIIVSTFCKTVQLHKHCSLYTACKENKFAIFYRGCDIGSKSDHICQFNKINFPQICYKHLSSVIFLYGINKS